MLSNDEMGRGMLSQSEVSLKCSPCSDIKIKKHIFGERIITLIPFLGW